MATIFLDRDGVINENRHDYVKSWHEFRFLPGSLEAIAELTSAGHRIVVCTNQAGIARGSMARDAVEDIHYRMVAQVAELGGRIEKVYYCAHGKNEYCGCRKPQPGLLLRARAELALDMTGAIFIGDSMTDVRAGQAAGVRTVLVLTGLGMEQLHSYAHEAEGPFEVAVDLYSAMKMLLYGFPEDDLEEEEWNVIVSKPHVRRRLRRLAAEARQQIVAGETEEGGFVVE